jgi:hypothetical protein
MRLNNFVTGLTAPRPLMLAADAAVVFTGHDYPACLKIHGAFGKRLF